MKKFATFAVLVALTFSASAVSVQWGYGGNTYVSEDGTTAKLASSFTGDASSSYIALVYVGQNVAALTDTILGNITSDDVVARANYAMGSTAKTANTWQMAGTSPAIVSSADYQTGASFAVLFNNGSSWDYFYNVDTASGAVGAAMTGNVLTVTDLADNAQAVSIYGTRKSGSAVAGSVTIPEPTSAALALAGLAMLIKRRKA